MNDGVIELWNLNTNVRETAWKKYDGAIGHVAFSGAGNLLAVANQRRSSSEQGTVGIWDTLTGQRKLELSDAFGPLVFSANDQRLGSTRLDGSVVIWDLATGLPAVEVPEDIIMAGGLSFCPVGDRLATGSEVHVVHIWDLATGKEVDSLRGSRMCIADVEFTVDGRTLLSLTVDSAIKLWNVATGAELLDIGHLMDVSSFLFSPNGEYLALSTVSSRGDPQVTLWRAPSFEEIAAAEAGQADAEGQPRRAGFDQFFSFSADPQ
jgi:WD40 repeat protein